MGRIEFARIQREALENYLIELIRAVVSRNIFIFSPINVLLDVSSLC
jgi:hypothetical protein